MNALADHYGIHRETGGLWLAGAKREVDRRTRALLRRKWDVVAPTVDAVIAHGVSDGMASLGRLLASVDVRADKLEPAQARGR